MRSTRSHNEADQDIAVPDAQVVSLRKAVLMWGAGRRADYPWRRKDVPLWQRLIAEVMLVRTKAEQVAPIWIEIVGRFPTPSALAALSLTEFQELIAPLGLRWRAARLHELATALACRNGIVPTTKGGLTDLPGVGDYCASAFLSLHADKREVIIDSNIVRLLSRYTGRSYDGETRRQPWLRAIVEQLTPARNHRKFNYALLDLAMSVCRPRPDCARCPLSRRCSWRASLGARNQTDNA